MRTLREASHRLRNSDWAGQINYIFGMARAFGGYTVGAQRKPNPTRWRIAANSYYTLATQNADYFFSKPVAAYDAIATEGSRINSELLSLRRDGAKFLTMLGGLLNDYKEAVKSVEIAAGNVVKRALTDAEAKAVWLEPEELKSLAPSLLSAIETQPILPAGDLAEKGNYRARDALARIITWGGPALQNLIGPVITNSGVPNFPHTKQVWGVLAADPGLFAAAVLGKTPLTVRYVYEAVPTKYKGAIHLTIYGNPLVAFHVYYGQQTDNRQKIVATTIVEARADTFLWWDASQCLGGIAASLCPRNTYAADQQWHL